MKLIKRVAMQAGLFIALFSAFPYAYAQKTVLFESLTFDDAMAKAKKTNKFIFVDVQGAKTSSFNQQVEENVFTLDSVAQFFNLHCISIKMNMATEEGKKFAPRLAMLMYPAYVFYDSNGDQLDFTNAGTVSKDPSVLMAKVRNALSIAKVKMENKRSIVFVKDSWKNLLARAKKENKMIFLDAYTEWCRPCIQMAKDVFTLNKVADFYNSNFINVSMDMEKGEGPELAKKYKIAAYPAFLYIDGDGNIVSRDGGYQEADKFIKAGETAISKHAAPATQASAFIRPVGLTKPGASKSATAAAAPEKVAPSAIEFKEGAWAQLLAEAKKSGKLIFMDAYTTWCGPCKLMRATVFTDQQVGMVYNRNFINSYIDMEKGEGLELRAKYNVTAYPTFLYINGDGEIVHKTVGSCEAEEFIQNGLDAISPKRNFRYLQQEYTKNAKDPLFIQTYLKALATAYEQKQANEVALAYLGGLKAEAWQNPDSWTIINEYLKDASSPVFQYVVNNRQKFEELYGKDNVAQKIHNTYLAWPITYMNFPRNAAPILDAKGFEQFISQIAQSSYDKKEEIIAKSRLTIYMSLRDWENYTATVNSMLQNKLVPMDANGAEQLYSYANNVSSFGKENQSALKAATAWVRISAEDIPQVRPVDKVTYLNLYALLLEQTNQRKLAKAVKKKIDKEKLNNTQNGAVFRSIRITPKQN